MEEKRILLVEDEIKIADTLKQGLSENGYTVDAAYDGLSGLSLFESAKYHLIVLDINLPGMKGYELCQRIRVYNEDVPIILLTALTSLNDKIEGYDSGADDFVIKPYEFKELLMKIRALLKRAWNHASPSGNVLKAGDLELNISTREVKRGKSDIKLTIKEFQLLEYLVRNKNRVLSRADIAINVWDIDFDTNTNVIDVYINYVRNKIDKPFHQKLIQTQVGKGYVLKVNY